MKKIFLLLAMCILLFLGSYAQSIDWRNAKNGKRITENGYCDQPYVSVLPNGKWLVVYTTGEGREGKKGQHIVSSVSDNQGKSWEDVVQIEPAGEESSSWAMPYVTKYGRIYVFYSYNGDKIHELNGKKDIREDMLGWYCYKYSDDNGKTWSERYRLNIPKTAIDFTNDWKGEVQIMWGIGKPIDVGKGMMFAFSKIGRYLLDETEGWFVRSDNINTEKDVRKLRWKVLPGSDYGVKNKKLGPISEEQNVVQLKNGTIYCMQRTISGHPVESYSYNGGKSWTTPEVPQDLYGIKLKNPRACPRIWKCENGKYLFWFHNHGGPTFLERNPVWISGGIEKNGKIIWSQPEILLYEDDIETRMSYPDLVEQNGRYWVTETNKEEARVHEIPSEFINKLWEQFEIKSLETKGLITEWKYADLKGKKDIEIPQVTAKDGFTINFRFIMPIINPNRKLFTIKFDEYRTADVFMGEFGAIRLDIGDGVNKDSWSSDPALITPDNEHEVAITIDNNAKIIQFIVDGVACNGRDARQYGWGRFKANMKNIKMKSISLVALRSSVEDWKRINDNSTFIRIYDRPLLNTEAIGNYRSYRK